MDENVSPNPPQPTVADAPPPPPQVANQPPAPPTGPKNKSVIIGGFFLILTFISLGVAIYFAYQNQQLKNQLTQAQSQETPAPTQTPDPTADWEVYQNSEVSISFKYPPSLETESWMISGGHGVATLSDPNITNPEPSIGKWLLSIQYLDNPNQLSLKEYQDYLESQKQPGGMNPPILYEESATTMNIGDKPSYYLKDQNCEPAACDRYVIPLNAKILEINVYNSNVDKTDKDLINQILSTFKFSD